jgi:hypothetical protein
MNQDVKKLWLDELRSGKYLQGKFALRQVDGSFCPLGVLCEVAVKAGVISPAKSYPYDEVRMAYAISTGGLPLEVEAWASLDSYTEITLDGKTTNIMGHNDNHDKTFAQIADAIEEQL